MNIPVLKDVLIEEKWAKLENARDWETFGIAYKKGPQPVMQYFT